MEASPKAYTFGSSLTRIDSILSAPAGSFEEKKSLPPREDLTFTNGSYANCLALFVDIRRSSELPKNYKRPVLAKIYRAFISEMVAIMTSHGNVREVNIVGDCVWSVVNAPFKSDIDEAFSIAAKVNSLTKVLNHKLNKKGYTTPVDVGIGMDYGRALMIKAGYSGSGINDVVYMGDVVNSAAHLARHGDTGQWWGKPITVGTDIYNNLNEANQGFFEYDYGRAGYKCDVVNIEMKEWLEAQS